MTKFKMKCYPGDEPRIDVTKDFVRKNRLKINKAIALDVMENPEKYNDDLFRFKREVATNFLQFDEVKHLFDLDGKEEKVKEIKSKWHTIGSVAEGAQDFLDYMVFAWMKARDGRGISASRSIDKLSTWMRILSRADVAEALEDEELYAPYGKPALIKACKMLGINYPEYLKE